MDDFKLSATLAGHEDDVRAVVFPDSNAVITASRDATVRLWKVLKGPPPQFDGTISQHGTAFVNAVTYLPPSPDFPEGFIVSGGKDTIIEVRVPSKAADDNAERLLIGHSSNICALDVDPAGQFIISGSWDGSAKIWPVGKWECEATLVGHEGSVWAVLSYDSDTIITGCADKLIRVFHRSGKLLKTVRGSLDVVRALCRTPSHPSGSDFASASNDGIIRLWKLGGQQVGELHGHESFIYSLAYLPSGEIVSSGEDRTVRVWRGNDCVQTITHPAISVWGVAACAKSGDIVTGASDKIARVFTRNPERLADEASIRLFNDSVKASSIPQQQVSEKINKETLPGPEFLQQKQGTKEGQVQMIREHDGSVTAHMWSNAQGEWTNVGTVVDSVGSSGKKVEYNGKEYDYVFDVDIEDGKPPLKLPFNLSMNVYEAATKFIENNKLPMTYLDQVANFITTNTQGATIGEQSQGPAPVGADPWGSEARYRPGGDTAPSSSLPPAPRILPQKEFLSIMVASVDKMQKKIEELNTRLIASGQKDVSLNPGELTVLQDLRNLLESNRAMQSGKPVPGGVDLTIKLVTQWPYSDRLPGLDLVRLLAAAPATATYRNARGGNLIDIIESSVTEIQPPAENSIMMAVRAFVNLFESEQGRELAMEDFSKIQSFTAGPILKSTTNRNLLIAATTLYINYAVLMTSKNSIASATSSFEYALAILEVLSFILTKESDSEVVYRAMVATGTLLGLDEEVKTAAIQIYGIEAAVKTATGKAKDPRVKNIAKEISGFLS